MKPTLTNERYTESDCRRLFAAAAGELRWLCYTLTGDAEVSEQALDAALEQSLKGATQVFREWMLSWARRLIIKFCIATVRPSRSALAKSAYPLFPMTFGSANSDHVRGLLNLPAATLQRRLMRMDALSRFVFVLRALEGYSRRDAALLLNIDDRACEWVYVWAVGTLGSDVARLEREEFGAVQPQITRAELGESVASLELAEAV